MSVANESIRASTAYNRLYLEHTTSTAEVSIHFQSNAMARALPVLGGPNSHPAAALRGDAADAAEAIGELSHGYSSAEERSTFQKRGGGQQPRRMSEPCAAVAAQSASKASASRLVGPQPPGEEEAASRALGIFDVAAVRGSFSSVPRRALGRHSSEGGGGCDEDDWAARVDSAAAATKKRRPAARRSAGVRCGGAHRLSGAKAAAPSPRVSFESSNIAILCSARHPKVVSWFGCAPPRHGATASLHLDV